MLVRGTALAQENLIPRGSRSRMPYPGCGGFSRHAKKGKGCLAVVAGRGRPGGAEDGPAHAVQGEALVFCERDAAREGPGSVVLAGGGRISRRGAERKDAAVVRRGSFRLALHQVEVGGQGLGRASWLPGPLVGPLGWPQAPLGLSRRGNFYFYFLEFF